MKIFTDITDRIQAIWYILTRRNFIVAGYKIIDKHVKGACFVEHLKGNKRHNDVFRKGIIDFIDPDNNNF